VDRLRSAAGNIILDSPEFQRLLRDAGARVPTEISAAEHSAPLPTAITGATTATGGGKAERVQEEGEVDRSEGVILSER